MTAKKTATATEKPTRAQMVQAACAQYGTGKLHKIEGVEPLALYTKVFGTKEFRDLAARAESFDERHTDGYNEERRQALELFDEDGQQLFDPENMEDMLYLANLPFMLRQRISLACAQINSGSWLKNG